MNITDLEVSFPHLLLEQVVRTFLASYGTTLVVSLLAVLLCMLH